MPELSVVSNILSAILRSDNVSTAVSVLFKIFLAVMAFRAFAFIQSVITNHLAHLQGSLDRFASAYEGQSRVNGEVSLTLQQISKTLQDNAASTEKKLDAMHLDIRSKNG